MIPQKAPEVLFIDDDDDFLSMISVCHPTCLGGRVVGVAAAGYLINIHIKQHKIFA